MVRIGKLLILIALAPAMRSSARADSASQFRDDIRPILEKHCYECHGPEKQKGDLNLAGFAEYDAVREMPEVWQQVLERVQAFEMPPKKAGDLDFGTHQRLVKWLRRLPKPENVDCDKLASDRTAGFYRGYVMSRRLNRAEYNNTIRDLVGLDLELQELLPADAGGGEGFDTTGNALFISSIHIEKYLAAADRVLDAVFAGGNVSADVDAARARVLIASPNEGLAPRAAAEKVLSAFARRAFRRPVPSEETRRFLAMFDRAWRRGDGFVPSVKLALKAILVSPNFLFLVEPEPAEGGVHRLGPYPLASRLSYFLWSSMPDEELFALAESGKLWEDQIYRQQIRRMLAHPRAEALGERFALQWLEMQELGAERSPDSKHFPEFNAELSEAMRGEVIAYFNHIFRNDRPVLELIDSNYTFANDRLARLYGLNDISGAAMRLVKLSDRNRGGLTGMAAVHALTSYPTRTSPVLRGRWILESLLGDKVPPPPPDVPALEEDSEKAAHLSLREQLELHRTKAECAACHDKMDPLGFGLENFDVLGRWRDQDRGQPIDAEGTLPSGQTFTGPAGLKAVLLERKDPIVKHLARKMAGYAYGRELNKFDECVIDKTMEALRAMDYRASVLIEQIAVSFPFQHRFYPKES